MSRITDSLKRRLRSETCGRILPTPALELGLIIAPSRSANAHALLQPHNGIDLPGGNCYSCGTNSPFTRGGHKVAGGAIGSIEVDGYAPFLQGADAMLKAANVQPLK